MSCPLYIVGTGANTAVGTRALAAAAAVRAGIVRFCEHPFWVDRSGQPGVTAAARFLPLEIMGSRRFVELGAPALWEALQPLPGPAADMEPVPLLLGLPLARPGTPVQLEDRLKQGLAGGGRRLQINTIRRGHAAGLLALQEAWRLVQAGQELCLIGGVDSYLQPESLEALDAAQRLKSGANRWGLVPGEAAGFCLLASAAAVRRYQLKPLARVRAVAITLEDQPDTAQAPRTGGALTRAMHEALACLPAGDQVHQVIGDLNGERPRTDEYGFTLTRLGGRFIDPTAVHTPADCWGDVGAASGPLFLALAALWAQRGYAHGPLTMVWTSSEDGTRGVALLEVHGFGNKEPSWH